MVILEKWWVSANFLASVHISASQARVLDSQACCNWILGMLYFGIWVSESSKPSKSSVWINWRKTTATTRLNIANAAIGKHKALKILLVSWHIIISAGNVRHSAVNSHTEISWSQCLGPGFERVLVFHFKMRISNFTFLYPYSCHLKSRHSGALITSDYTWSWY